MALTGRGETSALGVDYTSHGILTSALGLLTATHADRRMAGPVTVDYLAGVPTDRSQMLSLVAGMTALADHVDRDAGRGDRRGTRGDPGGVRSAGSGRIARL